MSIELRKSVHRKTVDKNYMGRKIIVSLLPGDVIGVREERTRKTFTAPISRIWAVIVRWNAEAEQAAKKSARRAKQ